MPLFQNTVLQKYLQTQDKTLIRSKWELFKNHFHNPTVQENIRNSKEEQYQEGFLIDLFIKILGYTKNPTPNFNLTTEYKNVKDSKKADGAILIEGKVSAVIELKGTETTDLSKIETQAFGYKNNQPDCKYIITSNFEKLRFYIDNSVNYIDFHLFELTEADFEILYLCLGYENVVKDLPIKINKESLSQEDEITKQLYKDYSLFKRELHQNLVQLNKEYGALTLFKKSQKLLDRFLFLFFAEDRLLLPPNSVRLVLSDWRDLVEKDVDTTLYARFQKYFGYLNTGFKGKRYDVFPYNGGLFKPDEVLDRIEIDDELLYKHTLKLSEYDFESEVDVNILGHIFENSLSEIEEVQAQLEGQEIDKKTSKRKKDGVFYTPKYITKYIVENTVGKLCEEKKEELQILDEYYQPAKQRSRKRLDNLNSYRDWLLQITICDPACGSGAFLNQALDFLINEHHYIDELSAKYNKDALVLSDVENSILEHNIYGVDINEESVEIAKLSLWLRTAQKNRKLNDLSNNIKCGNSLIDEVEIAGKKAFSWSEEFPEVFANGGFDVVIGNPPWGAKLDPPSENFLSKTYPVVPSKLKDSYLYFMLLGIKILKSNSYYGQIVPNTWLLINNTSEFRKNILSYEIKEIVDHGDGVFKDAIVESSSIFLKNNISTEGVLKAIKYRRGVEVINHFIDKKYWIEDDLHRIVIELKQFDYQLIKKMEKVSKPFSETSEIIFGIKPYQVGHGKPPQTREMLNGRIYHSRTKIDGNWKPLVTGTDVNRYICDFSDEKYIKYGEWLMYSSNQDKIESKKILLRRTSSDIRAVIDDENYYPQNSLFIITSQYDLNFILALLNSKLFDKIYKAKCPQIGKVFAEIKPSIIKSLPIIDLKKPNEILLKNVERIHLLNSEFLKLTLKLIRSLRRNFQIAKPSKKLQNWYELSFAQFIKELKKKKVTLSLAEEAEWEDYFLSEKKKAISLKAEIDKTDAKIDQMVYELYGLTEEEIKIVEG